jgi:riboflavin biosynthesis pyrimidine reductase
MDRVLRLWPEPDPTPLTDADLTAMYAVADRDQPWLRANFVTSLDGAVTVGGYSEGLSGTADKRVFGLLRMLCDALVVGAGTLRHEEYKPVRLSPERRAWRVEHGLAEHPTLVVVSRVLGLNPALPVFTEAPVRPVVVAPDSAPKEARTALAEVADLVVHGADEVDLRGAFTDLAGRGLRQVLCEGGPHLLGSLTAADLVDEFCLTVSPLLAGPGAGRITAGPTVDQPRHLTVRHVLAAEGALILRYTR